VGPTRLLRASQDTHDVVVASWHSVCGSPPRLSGVVLARLVESRAGRVRKQILLKFSPDCWLFIQDMQQASVRAPLPTDIQGILTEAPRIELRPPIPEPRFVVSMSRSQAQALHRWLHALQDGLSSDDPRWLTCLQCIGRVSGALSHSKP
jgi:hypothetical protein